MIVEHGAVHPLEALVKTCIAIAFSVFSSMAFSGDYGNDAKLVFIEYRKLNDQFLATVGAHHFEHQKLRRRELNGYSETEYKKILNSLEKYFCLSPHVDVLDEFLKTLVNTANSADEYPSYVFAALFLCEPDLVVNRVLLLNPNDKSIVIDSLDWGFKNITHKKESELPNYDVLLVKLNAIKRQGLLKPVL